MKIERYYSSKENLGLTLEYCGIEHCHPNFVMRPHSRDIFLFHYVFEGEGAFECHDLRHPFSAGRLFAIFPNNVVSYYSCGEKHLKFCWIGFSGENAEKMVKRIGLTDKEPVIGLLNADAIIALVQECIKKSENRKPHTELFIQSILYRFFGEIESCLVDYKGIERKKYVISEHIDRAKTYIGFNYMFPLTIKQIAHHVNLERTYFSRIFHQITGITPQGYLLDYRIKVAQRLLQESKYSIKEVGTMVGIPDPYYFSRAFKKIVGIPPSQWDN